MKTAVASHGSLPIMGPIHLKTPPEYERKRDKSLENFFQGSGKVSCLVIRVANDVCSFILKSGPCPEVFKTFFMLNSAEHEIFPAHIY